MDTNLNNLLARASAYDKQLPDLVLPAGHPDDRPIAAWIDHTLLKPEGTPGQIARLCEEARQHQFASVCINPVYIPLSARLLQGSQVPVCTVVGFPLGATLSAA